MSKINQPSNQPKLSLDGLYQEEPYSERELKGRRVGKVEARKQAASRFLAGIAIGAVGLTGAVAGTDYIVTRLDNQAEATRQANEPVEQQIQRTIDENIAREAAPGQQ